MSASDHDLLTQLLRCESPDGQFRLSVEPNDTFSSLTSKVLGFKPKSAVHRLDHQNANWDRQILGHLPSNTDASTIILSNKPIGHSAGEERLLNGLRGIRIRRVGLS
jgi:nuclear protein localization family protein 4